jgi:hypothetical protein
MRTINCPGCGFSFQSAAITKTRCRQCRRVVHIGSSPRAQSLKTADNEYDEAPAGAGWVLAGFGAAAAIFFWLWRRGAGKWHFRWVRALSGRKLLVT